MGEIAIKPVPRRSSCIFYRAREQEHDGDLPKLYTFVSAEPENVILTTIKRAEDSDDVILRFYETSGKDTTAIIQMTEDFKAARETDLLENETCGLLVQHRSIEVKTSKHEIKTIKLIT